MDKAFKSISQQLKLTVEKYDSENLLGISINAFKKKQDLEYACKVFDKLKESKFNNTCRTARYYLGLCYEGGVRCSQNLNEAKKWYKSAEYLGHLENRQIY
ncbi:23714_t:CDS:2 [Racocetra persica]|uniref:23714_t:CDS:1 n=1 Tax=Racocetra persica TaxID=160502 RepID=A0ACA9LHI4_9GLOM|nr:23714_t:CDS:2 [Racocetra persica]